jgi:hypothetical protein
MQKARRGLFWGQVGEVLQNINLRTRVHERNNITRLSQIFLTWLLIRGAVPVNGRAELPTESLIRIKNRR